MGSWSDVQAAAPDLAAAARARLDAHDHKTIATLGPDGSPQISGIQTSWADGELWLLAPSASGVARDLRRDERFALHSGTVAPSAWEGDAKLAGRAEQMPGQDPARFRVAPTEVTVIAPGADGIAVQRWSADA